MRISFVRTLIPQQMKNHQPPLNLSEAQGMAKSSSRSVCPIRHSLMHALNINLSGSPSPRHFLCQAIGFIEN